MSRIRSRTFYHQVGYKQWYSRGKPSGSKIPADPYTSKYETCVDELDPSYPWDQPHDLDIQKWRVSPLLSTKLVYGGYSMIRYPIALTNYNVVLPIEPAWDFWFTKAIANYNPNAPEVDLPLFLFEFKDFPKMLKHLGDLLHKVDNAYDLYKSVGPDAILAWNFGWAPLFSDLMSLASLGRLLDKRQDQLRNMEKKKKVRRSLGSGSSSSSAPDVFIGVGAANGNYPSTYETDYEVWFVSRPRLVDQLPGTAPGLWDSIDQVLGLELSYSTLWNMLPWSWLIDYFVNVGNFLDAYRGHIRWHLGNTYVMYHSTRKRVIDIEAVRSANPSGSYTGGVVSVESKRRQYRHNPSPRLSFDPFLTDGQMAILGALLTSDALKSKLPWS